MRSNREYIFLKVFLCFCCLSPSPVLAETKEAKSMKEKPMLGWIEKAKIMPESLIMHAKLSPGTETSSVGASKVKSLKKGKKRMVRFELTDRNGKTSEFTRELVRIAKIKRPGNDPIERYTVKLGLCIGKTFLEEEVTLADRKGFEYELLIGRSFLAGNLTIDPSLSYTVKPNCEES